jgi:hypothetical protein
MITTRLQDETYQVAAGGVPLRHSSPTTVAHHDVHAIAWQALDTKFITQSNCFKCHSLATVAGGMFRTRMHSKLTVS